MKWGAVLGVLAVEAALCSGAAAARGGAFARDAALESKIDTELRERNPRAADLFVEATASLDRENAADSAHAAALLEQVHQAAPWFLHATRRLCGVEAALGNRDRALALCREALAADGSSLNETAMAAVLIAPKSKSTPADVQEAVRLASDAVSKERPTTAYAQLVLCESELAADARASFCRCAADLLRLAPDEMSSHYFAAIAAATEGHVADAKAELEVARAKGLPDGLYRELRRAIEASEPPLIRWGRRALFALGFWLLGFALLFGAGALLSTATLKAMSRTPAEARGRAQGVDAVLRRTYRVVLWLTCAYYYASLPVVALVVVGLGLAFVFVCLAAGHIPVNLVLIAVVVVCGSLWAIAKSVFVRTRDEEPGDNLQLGDHPRLRAVLDEVAHRVGTRPVDSVYVTPGAEVAVFERGGILRQLKGQAERCLIVGAAALDGLRAGELKAILAHEYGHFQNADTAGGGFALAVRRSLRTMALHLARSGAASGLNPAWWFVRGFYAIFLRVSQGASRLQEVLADRWAAVAYGPDAFVRGLTHIVDRSVRFDAHMAATLREVVPKQAPLANVYAFVPSTPVSSEEVEGAVAQAMNRAAAPTDSHPSPADRIAWVTKLAVPSRAEGDGDAEEAWSLLASREAIEERMTAVIRARLAMRGVRVATGGEE
jgi:Zn-dependent protease with chaperone function